MIRVYRYRLYPTEQQKAELAKTFGCRRYICNYFVREHERAWQEEQKTLYEFDLIRLATEHKHDKPWLDGADSSMISWAAIGVIRGYRCFFDRVNVRPPREHKKGERPRMSYTTSGKGLNVSFRHNLVFLPKLGAVRAKLHRRFYGELKHATVTLNAAGRYYVSLCVDTRDGQVPMKPFDKQTAVGIDVGLRHFLTLSDNNHYEMPDMSRAYDRRAFLQRRLKQQREGSKRYDHTRLQIARLNEHIANARRDFHHKTAAKICARYSAIGMETFSAERMREGVGQNKTARDNGFNRKLCHVGLGQFSEILEAKAASTGTYFARIDRWEPSTKRCSACGHVNTDITLDVEEWTCPECGAHHDRDLNAAINIREKSLETILPLVEGKVKPAKAEVTFGPDERTGKVVGNDASRPSTQIDEGTALPRLAYNVERYLTQKAASPENFDQSIKRLRNAKVKEDSKYGVMEYLEEILPIVRVKLLCQELDIKFSKSAYIYTLKGTSKYTNLFAALQIWLPDMMEDLKRSRVEKAKRLAEEKRAKEAAISEIKVDKGIVINSMAYYVCSTTVAYLAGTSAPLVDNWALSRAYDKPKPQQIEKMKSIVEAYRQIGSELRMVSISDYDRDEMTQFCKDVRQLAQLNKVSRAIGFESCGPRYLSSIYGTPMINILMEFLNVTLPNMIEMECQRIDANIKAAQQAEQEARQQSREAEQKAKEIAEYHKKYDVLKNYFLK